MMKDYDTQTLLCANSRIITDRGVHVCPILIEQADSVLGQTLTQALAADYPLRHQACYTCWLHGAICTNTASVSSSTQA
jgi:AdoMet-dependent heme synthase